MFENIGKKIKGLSKIICYIEIAISFIIGVALLGIASEMSYGGEPLAIIGIIILVVGSLFSWIGSFFMYGFGELIDNSTIIRQNLTKKQSNYNATYGQASTNNVENNSDEINSLKASRLQVVSSSVPDGMKVCMSCGRIVPISQQICKCGEILADISGEIEESVFCNKCGADITNDKNSCHVCGTLIDSTVDGLEIFCPECKNDLKFMGYTEDDFKQEQTCPFCNAELKYDKGKK